MVRDHYIIQDSDGASSSATLKTAALNGFGILRILDGGAVTENFNDAGKD